MVTPNYCLGSPLVFRECSIFIRKVLLTISGLTISGLTSSLLPEALAGALLASTCHFLSVVVLYKLSQVVFSTRSTTQNQSLSFAVAVLHIINPAGAFLATPYSEAVFSLLNFTGFYAFLSGVGASHQPLVQDLKVLLAGILFGLATTVRSNGILSGVLFAYAAIDAGLQTLSKGISGRAIQRLLFLVVGGSLIALGAVYPQYVAYSEYCGVASEDVQLRPWCNARLPSIYSWVQSHYWWVVQSCLVGGHALISTLGNLDSCDTGLYLTFRYSPWLPLCY
jgi:phosphatidylinositol glycan class V